MTQNPSKGHRTLHVGLPNLGERGAFIRRVRGALSRRRLSNDGPLNREFERTIEKMLRVKHAISVCNATVGLQIACKALELKGEVILPSYTFVATAHALSWEGITPVFVDIDAETHNIHPPAVAKAITKKTTGIVGVHLWGRACDTKTLGMIAKKFNLKVMYDASHAFMCSHEGTMVGNFGECEVFSFHATKFINCIEGGAITTNRDDLAEKIRLMRNFGFRGFDNVISLGINGKMNEISAAMGLTNLEASKRIVKKNKKNYDLYKKGFQGVKGIEILTYSQKEKNNYQYLILEIRKPHALSLRDQIVKRLQERKIMARKYFWPSCHKMSPYNKFRPKHPLSQTNLVANRVIVLPTGQQIRDQDIKTIVTLIRGCLPEKAEKS